MLWALLLVLPGGLWVLGAVALVNALRRQRARWAGAPVLSSGGSAGAADTALAGCPTPPAGDATASTWF